MVDDRIPECSRMLIKTIDDKTTEVDRLHALANHPQATAEQRRLVEKEIRTVLSGIKGEKEAAYEIDFELAASDNWAVIHDLRLEHEGRVAQIDHIVINRFFDLWVCESKRFVEGIAINEHGECSAFIGGKPYGIGSPFAQNQKHCAVLKSVFDEGVVPLPKRLGIPISPTLRSLILISKNARISRPKTAIKDIDQILKVDQAVARMKHIKENGSILTMGKLIGSETLYDFACSLAVQHRPISFNWAARFGRSEANGGSSVAESSTKSEDASASTAQSTPSSAGSEQPRSKLTCASCCAPVPLNVARFCWFNKSRFGGKVFCRDCQAAVT